MMGFSRPQTAAFWLMVAAIMIAPAILYPVFLMKVMCFALFACAFNLLIGYVGLGSFGHAAFFGMGAYITAYTAKAWGWTPEIAILAGGMKSLVFGIATLTDVNFPMSGEVILMALLGGMGTIFGPVVGAAIVITMQNYLAPFGAWVTVTQGVVFVVCVLAFRRGLIGELAARRRLSL